MICSLPPRAGSRSTSFVALVTLLALGNDAIAQSIVDGAALALRSSGTVAGKKVTLDQNGFVGTYISIAAAGPVQLTVNASGTISNGVASRLTVSVADFSQSFSVGAATAADYSFTTPPLPAGTYFIRTQLDDHNTVRVDDAPVVADTALTIERLAVGPNVTVLNAATDANAIAAANTYIAHFRKTDAVVKAAGAAPGSSVKVRLKRNAFNLGTFASGGYSATDNYLQERPAAGSDAAYFQEFIDGRFDCVVPSNAGKWGRNEAIAADGVGTVDMAAVDQMMAYAAAHGMTARQHNVIWGNQQPEQVKTWLTTASSDTASAADKASAVARVKAAIANRVTYYVSGVNGVNGHVRAADYEQLDVLNEAQQTGNYLSVLGYAGVAEVYRQAQTAVAAAGLKTRLYTNEYNVLQNSPTTITPSPLYGKQAAATYGDRYANWYRRQIESINDAAIAAGATGNVVTGVGVQYYPTATGTLGPAVIQAAMQNLAVTGLPTSLTEFGGQPGLDAAAKPQIVDDAIRMMMGTPSVDSFMYWGWYDKHDSATNRFGGGTTMVNPGWKNADGTWNLTATGRRFEYLFGRGLDPTGPGARPDGSNPDPWTTDLTLTIGADGNIKFNGFYGDYVVTLGGKDYGVSLLKGVDNGDLKLATLERKE